MPIGETTSILHRKSLDARNKHEDVKFSSLEECCHKQYCCSLQDSVVILATGMFSTLASGAGFVSLTSCSGKGDGDLSMPGLGIGFSIFAITFSAGAIFCYNLGKNADPEEAPFKWNTSEEEKTEIIQTNKCCHYWAIGWNAVNLVVSIAALALSSYCMNTQIAIVDAESSFT